MDGTELGLSIGTVVLLLVCCACREISRINKHERRRAKLREVKLPMHLVAPNKSFGEPVSFYTMPISCSSSCSSTTTATVFLNMDNGDDNKTTDTLPIQDDAKDVSVVHIPPNKNDSSIGDPFACQDAATSNYTIYRPALPRYTTLPPPNVYPIPPTPGPRSNSDNQSENSDGRGEDIVEAGETAFEVFSWFDDD